MKRTLALLLLSLSAVLANISQWVPDADSLVTGEDPEGEWGDSELLAVRLFDYYPPIETRSFMHFDLPEAPPDTYIDYGILELDLDRVDYPGGEIGIYKVTESWDESTVNWNNQPTYDPAKMMFHGWIHDVDIVDIRLEGEVPQEGGCDPSENYGMIFATYNYSSPLSIFFYSRESDSSPILWPHPDPYPVESLSWGGIKAIEW